MFTDAERAAISELIHATLLAVDSRNDSIRSFSIIYARRAIMLIERSTKPYLCTDDSINEFVQAWADMIWIRYLGQKPVGADETPRKTGGRPSAREPGSRITTWVPASEHERLIRLANQRDESLSAYLRRVLARRPKS